MGQMRLLTRGDDGGINRTANRAIRAAAKQGILRNISLLAPSRYIEDAADVLLDLSGQVDFGLQVCFTAEWEIARWRPVSASEGIESILRDDGSFPYTTEDFSSGPPPREAMVSEIEAQYRSLADVGFELTFVSEYMNIGNAGPFAEAITEVAEKHNLLYHRTIEAEGVVSPLPDWDGPGPHPGTELADHIAGVTPGTYLVAGQPGFKSDEMQRLRRPGEESGQELLSRNRQRRMFADIEIVDYCATAGIKLLRYSDLR